MSRLYEIIRQIEERSSSAPPLSHQEMVVISPENAGSKKGWWRFYRTVILIVIITALAIITITLGPKLIPTLQTQKATQLVHLNAPSQTTPHQSQYKEETHKEALTTPAAVDKTKTEKTERGQDSTSAQAYSSQDGTKDAHESEREKSSTTPSARGVIPTSEKSIDLKKESDLISVSGENGLTSTSAKTTQKTELDKATNISGTSSPEKKTGPDTESSIKRSTTSPPVTEEPFAPKRASNSISGSSNTRSTNTPDKTPQKGKSDKSANTEKTSPPKKKNAPVPHSPTVNIAPQNGIIVIAEEARRRGDTDEALRIYKQYLALHRDPYAMNNLGALLILKGQFKEAEQVLQEAFQLAPTDGDIAANLIGVEMMIGKSSQACEILSRFKKGSTPIPPAIKALEPYLGNCQ